MLAALKASLSFRVNPDRTGLPTGLPFLSLRWNMGCSPTTTVCVGTGGGTTTTAAETFTVRVAEAVSGGELVSDAMIVIATGPAGRFEAGVQVNTPVVGLMLAPAGAAAQFVGQCQGRRVRVRGIGAGIETECLAGGRARRGNRLESAAA